VVIPIMLLTVGLFGPGLAAGALLPSQFFPPDNIWNTEITNLPVHSMSATWMATVGASKNLHVGFYPDQWGMRYNLVDANTPTHTVRIVNQDPADSDLIPYPFTAQTLIQLGTPDSEAFMIDPDALKLDEMYNAHWNNGDPWASATVRWDLTSNALRADNRSSADEAGLPLFPGLMRWDEVQRGVINHAFRFMNGLGHINGRAGSHLWPARHDGFESAPNDNAPPMGARLRLRASYDISGFSANARVILTAMKKYGMFLADHGIDWELVGTADSGWPTSLLSELGTIPASQFDFVDESSLMIDPNSAQARQASVLDTMPPVPVSDLRGSNVPVASVTVSPASASVVAGSTTQLTATPKSAAGSPLTGRVVTWSSDNTAAATVNGSGLVSGVAAGAATITATCEGKTGTSAITVTAPGSSVTFVGAGDIAEGGGHAQDTANLLDAIPGSVFTSGDNAYPDGTTANFNNYYTPTWGRHKARTYPVPGNHDYHVANAANYFTYFGAAAGTPGSGYYSYNLGDWHVVALNSEINTAAGSPQEQWLRADLAANTKQCTIAYWHQPVFNSGDQHGSSTKCKPLWQALQDFGAEIVICGHEHIYERFAPQTANGVASATGIREFVVGTGGANLYTITTPIANSEARNTNTWGVLKLTLGPGTYSWQFIPIAGRTYTDSGSGTCHN